MKKRRGRLRGGAMKRVFRCPRCEAILNPNVKIILSTRKGSHRGLFLFSPKPGNYDLFIPSDFPLAKGDIVEFGCPVCGGDLTSNRGPGWAEIRFQNPGWSQGAVVFSKENGRHATYFIAKEEVRSYGKDAPEAVNFFGAGPDR
jgi:hypothetical protein